MSTASGFTTSKKSLSTVKGYTVDQSTAKSRFQTIESAGSDRVAADIAQRALYIHATGKIVTSATKRLIVATAHSAAPGDVIRFTSGALSGMDFPVLSCPTADILIIESEFDTAPSGTDTFDVFKWTFVQVSSTGSQMVTVVPSPQQINVNGVATTINNNTVAPENSIEMPTKDYDVLVELQKQNAQLIDGDVSDYTFDDATGQTLYTGVAKKIRLVQNGGEMLYIYKNLSRIGALEAGGKFEFNLSMIVTDSLIIKSKSGIITTNISWNIFN